MGKDREPGVSRAGLLCLGGRGWLVDEPPPPPQLAPTVLGRESVPVREGMLSWRLNAESIQLCHPPLHLTFQGTRISSLRCQTFSTCYFALVPHVNSSGVSGGRAGRSGSAKVDAKMGMRVRLGPSDLYTLLPPLASCSAHDDTVGESKKVSKSAQWSVQNMSLTPAAGDYFCGTL